MVESESVEGTIGRFAKELQATDEEIAEEIRESISNKLDD